MIFLFALIFNVFAQWEVPEFPSKIEDDAIYYRGQTTVHKSLEDMVAMVESESDSGRYITSRLFYTLGNVFPWLQDDQKRILIQNLARQEKCRSIHSHMVTTRIQASSKSTTS